MKEAEMETIADMINKIISTPKDENAKAEVAEEIKNLTSKFKLYDDLKIG
jgi:glycine/serine hydroxymethyltransferase